MSCTTPKEPKYIEKIIKLANIDFEESSRIQQRDVDANKERIEEARKEYTGMFRSGLTPVNLPRLCEPTDHSKLIIIDGNTTCGAALDSGLTEIKVRMCKGTKRDAQFWACFANLDHGLSVNNSADRKKRVLTTLKNFNAEFPSNVVLAKWHRVSETYIRDVRKEFGIEPPKTVVVKKKNGRKYKLTKNPKPPSSPFPNTKDFKKLDKILTTAFDAMKPFQDFKEEVRISDESGIDLIKTMADLGKTLDLFISFAPTKIAPNNITTTAVTSNVTTVRPKGDLEQLKDLIFSLLTNEFTPVGEIMNKLKSTKYKPDAIKNVLESMTKDKHIFSNDGKGKELKYSLKPVELPPPLAEFPTEPELESTVNAIVRSQIEERTV